MQPNLKDETQNLFFIKDKTKRRLPQAAQNGHAFFQGKIATSFPGILFTKRKYMASNRIPFTIVVYTKFSKWWRFKLKKCDFGHFFLSKVWIKNAKINLPK
jgi:hypothetical protein